MALAQELFSTAAVEDREGGVSSRTRTGRTKKGTTAEPEGKLARTVGDLRALEDSIVSRLAAAERVLRQLVSRHVHEDAGYASSSELEERILAASPLLSAMREALPAPVRAAAPVTTKREPGDTRTRGLKALTSVARAIERIRSLDKELRQLAATARDQLRGVETLHLFEECGYASFEEFLERALGPSPMLSCAVSFVGSEPAEQPVEEEHRKSGFDPVAESLLTVRAFSTVLLDETPQGASPETDILHSGIAEDGRNVGTGGAPVSMPSLAAAGLPNHRGVARAIALCMMATVFGAGAGAWTELAALRGQHVAPEVPVCAPPHAPLHAPLDKGNGAPETRPDKTPQSRAPRLAAEAARPQGTQSPVSSSAAGGSNPIANVPSVPRPSGMVAKGE